MTVSTGICDMEEIMKPHTKTEDNWNKEENETLISMCRKQGNLHNYVNCYYNHMLYTIILLYYYIIYHYI